MNRLHKFIALMLTIVFFVAFIQPVHAEDDSLTMDSETEVALDQPTPVQDSDEELAMADATPLHSSQMEETRAGFMDPSGLILRFAVDVKTQVDGDITFTRSIVMMPDASGHLAASSQSSLTQNGTSTNVIDNGRGIEVVDAKGRSTILNQLADGSLGSVIVNSANNRDIAQNVDINLVLKGANLSGAMQGAVNSVNGLAQGANLHRIGFGL